MTTSLFSKVDSADPRWQTFAAMAASLERTLGPEWYAGLTDLQNDLNLDALVEALKTGNAEALADDVLDDPLLLQRFRVAVQNAVQEAGEWAATPESRALPAALTIAFDGHNPRAVAVARREGAALVQQVSEDVRGMIRAAVADGIQRGLNPVDTARGIRDGLGLTARQWNAVANYRRALELGQSAALDRELRDRRFDASVRRAIAEKRKLSAEKIDRMVGRYTERYRAYRAQTVMRTESLRALGAGQRLAWQQAFDEGKANRDSVRRYLAVAGGPRTCDFCIAVEDANADGVGFDEPFDTPDGPADAPPFHPDCRCYVFTDLSG